MDGEGKKTQHGWANSIEHLLVVECPVQQSDEQRGDDEEQHDCPVIIFHLAQNAHGRSKSAERAFHALFPSTMWINASSALVL